MYFSTKWSKQTISSKWSNYPLRNYLLNNILYFQASITLKHNTIFEHLMWVAFIFSMLTALPSALSLSILEHCISFLFFLVLMIGPWGAIATVRATLGEPWDLMSTGTALQLPSLFLYHRKPTCYGKLWSLVFEVLLFLVWPSSKTHQPKQTIFTQYPESFIVVN